MRGDGTAELPALAEPAAKPLDALALDRGIDALGDDADAGGIADARRRGDRRVARGARVAGDKAAIELDGVKADTAQLRERLGAPAVVDHEPDAGVAQLAQVLAPAHAVR